MKHLKNVGVVTKKHASVFLSLLLLFKVEYFVLNESANRALFCAHIN